jgi:pimeloyl-ACP methyl ester carboxylesterase
VNPDPLIELQAHRRRLELPSGPASVLDTGGAGPATVFVHGAGTNALLWRRAIRALADRRRCVAPDLPLHGQTPMRSGQDVSLPALARFVADCCDALDLDTIDLVGNDTGGAVAQVFAAHHPERLRTLTLTNCEAHDNIPPRALLPGVLMIRLGMYARLAPRLMRDHVKARRRVFRTSYQDIESLPVEVSRAFLEPIARSREVAELFQQWMLSIHKRDLLAVEPQLRNLRVPTLIAWGTDDVFSHRRWAQWLRELIPGAQEVRYFDGGRLFWPDERADELLASLDAFWQCAQLAG